MRVFGAAEVHRLLDYPRLVEALRVAHAAGTPPTVARAVTGEPGGGPNAFVGLLAWAAGDAVAVKLVGVFPGNADAVPPRPTVQGLVAVFDGRDGAPVLVADGAAVTFRKTAADSALATDLLARPDARRLLLVGAGGLARHVAEATLAVRPGITEVAVWNRTPARARQLAADLARPGLAASAVEDLDAAVARADVVSCTTMATAPLVKGACLRPGTHLDLIGAYRPDMREADDEAVQRGTLFVDTRADCESSGEIAAPLAAGVITRASIVADLFDLCAGRHPGRRGAGEVTLFKNVGGAHLDLFTARHLLARAEEEAGG